MTVALCLLAATVGWLIARTKVAVRATTDDDPPVGVPTAAAAYTLYLSAYAIVRSGAELRPKRAHMNTRAAFALARGAFDGSAALSSGIGPVSFGEFAEHLRVAQVGIGDHGAEDGGDAT